MLRVPLGLVFALSLVAGSAAAERPRAFLELFTSQGCASCPAADALLGELAERKGIMAVTMPVKLWDFLGWADTLASEALTRRQLAYSVARGDRDVYTPQMVVNGRTVVLGSDETAIDAAVPETPLPLPIDIASRSGVLAIEVGDAEIDPPRATLWLLVVDDEVRVPVRAGENRGRRLVYHNVVRAMRPIGMWKGEPLVFDLPLADGEKSAATSAYVIAQVDSNKGPGAIVGAARLEQLHPARAVDAGRHAR